MSHDCNHFFKPERAPIFNFLKLRTTEIVSSQWGAVQAPGKSNTDLTTPNTAFSHHKFSYLIVHIILEKRCSGQLPIEHLSFAFSHLPQATFSSYLLLIS